jgi:hypothetical protein
VIHGAIWNETKSRNQKKKLSFSDEMRFPVLTKMFLMTTGLTAMAGCTLLILLLSVMCFSNGYKKNINIWLKTVSKPMSDNMQLFLAIH